MPRPQAGDRINNYLLAERVGVGSFGEVWKAYHHIFKEPVAIKIPTDPQYVRHLQREGTVIHGLRDPHIVRALDLDPYADPPYLIMEYVDGPSVRQLIQKHPGGLPIDAAVAITYGILLALDVAHRNNLIHRDIKPENVLISGHDVAGMTPSRVKVADFGLGEIGESTARQVLQSGSMTPDVHRHMTGTIVYMAPEVRDGAAQIDARSDLYSVGVVLHEMLTGVLPQGSDLPSAIRTDSPRWLDGVFERCYTRLERRYASASDMRAAIERYWSAPPSWAAAGGAAGAGHEPRTRCPRCERAVGPEDQFCIHCGAQLVDVVPRCPACHAYVSRGDNFCILCGMDLRVRA